MNYADIRQQVIDGCLSIQRKGLIRGTSGNISVRGGDGVVMAISPSGIPYEELTQDMIPVLDLYGHPVDEYGRKPSSELPMHLAVMKARPDVGAVVHTHSRFSTIIGILGEELPVLTIPLMFYAPNPAPIAPFELPGSAELGEGVVQYLGNGHAVIMEHHGLLTVGTTIEEAITCSEYIEEGAEIAYYCRLATGSYPAIPEDKVNEMLRILDSGRTL